MKKKPWPEVGEGIDYTLLQDEWITAPWINLGDWSETEDYRYACQQLALRLGQFIGIKARDCLLELACGYGAGLWLWQEAFGNQKCDALEFRKECVDYLEANPPVNLDNLIASKAEAFFAEHQPPSPSVEACYDAILCVDAAYHFSSIQDFLGASLRMLKPGGRLGFHLFCLNSEKPLSPWIKKLFQQADIDSKEFRTEEDLIQEMRQQGWQKVKVQDFTKPVFGGFASFIGRRSKQLRLGLRWKPAWFKILTTAWLCGKVLKEESLKFMMVRAERNA